MFSHLPKGAPLIFSELTLLAQQAAELHRHAEEQRVLQVEAGELPAGFPRPYLLWDELLAQAAALAIVNLSNNEALVRKIQKAFDRVAWEKDFVLCEGSGHAGVGSVFDLSNAQVAKILGAKVIIVTQGGIGKPIDEVALNQALFEKEGVEIIGVIINKVIGAKLDYVSDFARRGFKRRGLELLGVLPHERILSKPTIELIRDELKAELLNGPDHLHNLVDDVVVGAMGAQNALSQFKRGVLLITPGDREDLIVAAWTALAAGPEERMAGIVLTGNLRPNASILKLISTMPIPVLLTAEENYEVASAVHDLNVKTRPTDVEKISLIRRLVAKNVNLKKILEAL